MVVTKPEDVLWGRSEGSTDQEKQIGSRWCPWNHYVQCGHHDSRKVKCPLNVPWDLQLCFLMCPLMFFKVLSSLSSSSSLSVGLRSIVSTKRPGSTPVCVSGPGEVASAWKLQWRDHQIHRGVPACGPGEPSPVGGHRWWEQDHQRRDCTQRQHSLPVQSQGLLQSAGGVEQVREGHDPRRW